MINWKKELKRIIENGCTDSDIEDFELSHKEISGNDIWTYADFVRAPEECKYCKNFRDCPPTKLCSRKVKIKDMFEWLPNYEYEVGDRVEFIPNCAYIGSGVVVDGNDGGYFCRVGFDSGDYKGMECIMSSQMLRKVKK